MSGTALAADLLLVQPGEHCMDELMIVRYKNRLQFLRMACSPGYWPLA